MADRLKAETLADIIRAHKAARMTDNREKMASLQQRLPAGRGEGLFSWIRRKTKGTAE